MMIGKGFLKAGVLALGLWATGGVVESVDAALFTQWDVMNGAQNWNGNHGGRQHGGFYREASFNMGGRYSSPMTVEPFLLGAKNMNPFMWGGEARHHFGSFGPRSFGIDPFSFLLGLERGYELRSWHRGFKTAGFFSSERFESRFSWERIVDGGKHEHRHHDRHDDFKRFLHHEKHGHLNGGTPAPVAIPASVLLYATGLFGVGSWTWLKRRRPTSVEAQAAA